MFKPDKLLVCSWVNARSGVCADTGLTPSCDRGFFCLNELSAQPLLQHSYILVRYQRVKTLVVLVITWCLISRNA